MIVTVILTVAAWKTHCAINLTLPWLDVIYYLSTVKLIITLLKYLPQALLNYKRKSTHGWAINASLLDLMGGVFSLAQMFLLAWNHGESTMLNKAGICEKIWVFYFSDDWSSLQGNVAKLGLGLFSVMFDVIFAIQHFVLYK